MRTKMLEVMTSAGAVVMALGVVGMVFEVIGGGALRGLSIAETSGGVMLLVVGTTWRYSRAIEQEADQAAALRQVREYRLRELARA